MEEARRCDLVRRGHCGDRSERTAIAALSMRCQIGCEGSPGLHGGGQHKAVMERSGNARQDYVTNTCITGVPDPDKCVRWRSALFPQLPVAGFKLCFAVCCFGCSNDLFFYIFFISLTL